MTTVIGVVYNSGVLMAADRAAFLGTQRETLTEPKIIQFNNVLIGVAGTLLVFQRVKACITAWCFDFENIAEVSRKITEVMEETTPVDERNAEFLVGIGGKLYTVLSNGTYLEAQRGYAAIGSGAAYALGALYMFPADGAFRDLATENALQCAAEFDSGTAAPFDFIKLEEATA